MSYPNQVKILCCIALAAAGCVSSGTKVTGDQLAQFKDGTTTEAQIVAKLGPPNSASTSTDGSKTDIYVHIAASANAASYIPVVGLFAGGAKGTNDSVVFNFDSKGVLKSHSSSTGQMALNTGLLNQK